MPVNEKPFVPLPPHSFIGTYLAREKRFTIKFMRNNKLYLAHTNNTGAMMGLLRRGAPALFSPAQSKNRKLPFTLERIYIGSEEHGLWTGVNTMLANRLFEAAFYQGSLGFLSGYTKLRREAKRKRSRFDFCLYGEDSQQIWIECKSVTLVEEGTAYFPDAASIRGRKHLEELIEAKNDGERAIMFYLVQRPDSGCFCPADFIDPDYASLFWRALDAGVEMYAYNALLLAEGTGLGEQLPLGKIIESCL